MGRGPDGAPAGLHRSRYQQILRAGADIRGCGLTEDQTNVRPGFRRLFPRSQIRPCLRRGPARGRGGSWRMWPPADDALFALTARFGGYTPAAQTVQAAPEWSARRRRSRGRPRTAFELAARRIGGFTGSSGSTAVRGRQPKSPGFSASCRWSGSGSTPPAVAAYPRRSSWRPSGPDCGRQEISSSPAREGSTPDRRRRAAGDAHFKIGGAQAVAALAYGPPRFPRWTRSWGGQRLRGGGKMLVFGQRHRHDAASSEVLSSPTVAESRRLRRRPVIAGGADRWPPRCPDADAYARRVTAEVEQLPTLSRQETPPAPGRITARRSFERPAEAVALANRSRRSTWS